MLTAAAVAASAFGGSACAPSPRKPDARPEPASGVYNWQPSNTSRLQRSLESAASGEGFSDQLIVGDSLSSSLTGSTTSTATNFPAMWPRRLQGLLAARGLPPTGSWIFANDTTDANDDRWSFTGSTWTDGYGFRATKGDGAVTATFTADLPGTVVSVAYQDVSWMAPFTIAIDGGSPVPIRPSDATGKISVYTVTGLELEEHTVTIAGTATNLFVLAATCHQGSGVRIHNASQQGARAMTTWGEDSGFNVWTTRAHATTVLVPNPDVLHLALGANDIGHGASSADTIAALVNIRNHFAASDVILYAEYDTGAVAADVWAAHVADLYALADTLDCPMIDFYRRWGTHAAATTKGLVSKDGIHLNDTAQAEWASLVAAQLLGL